MHEWYGRCACPYILYDPRPFFPPMSTRDSVVSLSSNSSRVETRLADSRAMSIGSAAEGAMLPSSSSKDDDLLSTSSDEVETMARQTLENLVETKSIISDGESVDEKASLKKEKNDRHDDLEKDESKANIQNEFGVCGWILTILSYILIIVTLPISACMCIKVVQEYERAVIFRLGRLMPGGAKGPGIFLIVPCIDTYRKVDLRVLSFEVPPQEILSKDSVTVAVDAVVYFRISNATISVTNVEDAARSTKLLAQTTLRNILGTKTLAEMLSDREAISHQMQSTLDEATEPWGVKVERVEVKDVRLPVQLQRAMAAEAEAAREARAKVIVAEGEQKASRALKEAAEVIAQSPSALQLRYLQTLNSISAEKNSTIIFPFPIDLLSAFLQKSAPKVEEPPPLPKKIRSCCLYKYPDWVQGMVGEGKPPVSGGQHQHQSSHWHPPGGSGPSTTTTSGRPPLPHSMREAQYHSAANSFPPTAAPTQLDPGQLDASRRGAKVHRGSSGGANSLLKQAIANRLKPGPEALTPTKETNGKEEEAMSKSIVGNAAWYRDDDGRTGFKPKEWENMPNQQKEQVKNRRRKKERQGESVEEIDEELLKETEAKEAEKGEEKTEESERKLSKEEKKELKKREKEEKKLEKEMKKKEKEEKKRLEKEEKKRKSNSSLDKVGEEAKEEKEKEIKEETAEERKERKRREKEKKRLEEAKVEKKEEKKEKTKERKEESPLIRRESTTSVASSSKSTDTVKQAPVHSPNKPPRPPATGVHGSPHSSSTEEERTGRRTVSAHKKPKKETIGERRDSSLSESSRVSGVSHKSVTFSDRVQTHEIERLEFSSSDDDVAVMSDDELSKPDSERRRRLVKLLQSQQENEDSDEEVELEEVDDFEEQERMMAQMYPVYNLEENTSQGSYYPEEADPDRYLMDDDGSYISLDKLPASVRRAIAQEMRARAEGDNTGSMSKLHEQGSPLLGYQLPRSASGYLDNNYMVASYQQAMYGAFHPDDQVLRSPKEEGSSREERRNLHESFYDNVPSRTGSVSGLERGEAKSSTASEVTPVPSPPRKSSSTSIDRRAFFEDTGSSTPSPPRVVVTQAPTNPQRVTVTTTTTSTSLTNRTEIMEREERMRQKGRNENDMQRKFVARFGARRAPMAEEDPLDPGPTSGVSMESVFSTDSRESVVSEASIRKENSVRRNFNY